MSELIRRGLAGAQTSNSREPDARDARIRETESARSAIVVEVTGDSVSWSLSVRHSQSH